MHHPSRATFTAPAIALLLGVAIPGAHGAYAAQPPASAPAAAPAPAPTPTPAPAQGLTAAGIVGALQDAGLQAQRLDAPASAGVLAQILTGAGDYKVVLIAASCPGPNEALACGLLYNVAFSDIADVTDGELVGMNEASFVKVARQRGTDGTVKATNVSYFYLCEGLTDPKVVPTVLRDFVSGVSGVLSTYRTKIRPAATPAAAAPGDPPAPKPPTR